MANDITTTPPPSDGFDDTGDDRGSATFVKFDPQDPDLWVDRNHDPIARKPWIAVKLGKEAVRWGDKQIAERQSGDADIDALNAAIPEEEWELSPIDQKPKPPWSMQYTVFMANPEDGSRIISSNSTFGQRAAYADLKDRVSFMRKYRGAPLVPVVELSSKPMKTRFGTRSRPDYKIIDWRDFGGGGDAPAIAAPVAPLTSKEIVNDSIDDVSPAPKALWEDEIPEME